MDQLSHRYPAGGAGLWATWSSLASSRASALRSPPDPPHSLPLVGAHSGPLRRGVRDCSPSRGWDTHQTPAWHHLCLSSGTVPLHPKCVVTISAFAFCELMCVCVSHHFILRYVLYIPLRFLTTGLKVHLLMLPELIRCGLGSYS